VSVPAPRPLPTGIRGFNVGPSPANFAASNYVWSALYSDWANSWPSLKLQVDLAASIGANTIRLIGDVYGIAHGLFTRARYLARVGQVIAYCQSKGLQFYATAGGAPHYACSTDVIVAESVAYAGFVAGFPNVVAVDLCQEAWTCVAAGTAYDASGNYASAISGSAMTTMMQQLKAGTRRVAPNLPLTFSAYGTDVLTDGAWASNIRPIGVDFFDGHLYVTNPSLSEFAGLKASVGGLPILFGECGCEPGSVLTAGAQAAAIAGQQSLLTRPDVAGSLVWAAINTNQSNVRYFGVWDPDGSPVADRLAACQSYPRQPASLPTRRRRRHA